jgi:hypothetical protein
MDERISGSKLVFWKVPGFIWKFVGVMVNVGCNLEKVEGFICKIEGLGPIYMKNSKTKGLGVKFAKDFGPWVDIDEWQGPKCKLPQI